jgi:hypothetical protein
LLKFSATWPRNNFSVNSHRAIFSEAAKSPLQVEMSPARYPLFVAPGEQIGTEGQAGCGIVEDRDKAGSTLDLSIYSFKAIGCSYSGTVSFRQVKHRESHWQVFLGSFSELRRLFGPDFQCLFQQSLCFGFIGGVENRPDALGDRFALPDSADVALGALLEMELAALPEDAWQGGSAGCFQSGVVVGDDPFDAAQSAPDQAVEEGRQCTSASDSATDTTSMLPLPAARIKPLLVALYELYRVGGIDEEGTIKLTTARAAELVEMAAAAGAAGLRWFGGERLLEIGRRLKDFSGIEAAPVPAGLKGSLRHYQQEGVNWLQFLRDFGFAGILADDMGLGKTVQALTHLLIEQEAGRLDRPALVIAPTSLMTNWRMEAARFAPSLRVLTLHGSGRKAEFERIGAHDLVLTTYPLLFRDKEALLANECTC